MIETGGRYVSTSTIGAGAYGCLFLVQDQLQADRPYLALKKTRHPNEQAMVLREIGIMRRLHHRSLIELVDVVPRGGLQLSPYLIMEYAPMDLRSFLNAFCCGTRVAHTTSCGLHSRGQSLEQTDTIGQPDETPRSTEGAAVSSLAGSLDDLVLSPGTDEVASPHAPPPPMPPSRHNGVASLMPLHLMKSVVSDVLEGCAAMHARGIMHRDLKPENILIYPFGTSCPEPLRICKSGTTHIPLPSETISARIHATYCRNPCCCDRTRALRDGEAFEGTCPPCPMVPLKWHPQQHTNGNANLVAASYAAAARSTSHFPAKLSPCAKIADFGSARMASKNYNTTAFPVHVNVGDRERGHWVRLHSDGVTTLPYRAPEALCRAADYSEAADVFAVGCIMYELAAGARLLPEGRLIRFQPPSPSCNPEVVAVDDGSAWHFLVELVRQLGLPTEEEWAAFTDPMLYDREDRNALPRTGGNDGALWQCRNELTEMLTADGYDLLRGMLRYNPTERITAAEALKHPFFNR